MVASFRLDIDGQDVTLFSLDRLAGRFENMHPLMERIAQYGEDSTRQRFVDGIAPDGEAWVPSYRAKREGGQTLRDQGHLQNSQTNLATAHTAEWGTNLIYAGVHQFGDTIRAKGEGPMTFNIPGLGWRSAHEVVIPQREFLGLSPDDEAEIQGKGEDYIAEVMP